MKRLRLIFVFILGFAALFDFPLPARADGTGAAFLKIGMGARPTGMGNAFTAVANDINSITWNPAGLSLLNKKEFGAMHAELFADTRYDFIGYAQPLAGRTGGADYGTIGFAVQYLSQGTIEGRSADRRAAGEFSGSDKVFNMAFSRRFNSSLLFGANLKYLNSSIENESARTFALDIGGMYRFLPGFMAGFAVQNIGPGIKFIDQRNSLPLTLAIGAGYEIGAGLLLALDVKNRPNDNKTIVSMGTEYAVFSALSLRAGYLAAPAGSISGNGIAANIFGDMSGLGAGLGLKAFGYSLDYAFMPFGELGNVQRISLGARF